MTISVTAVDEPPIFSAGATSVMFDEVTGIDGNLSGGDDGEIGIPLSEAYVAGDAETGNPANAVTLGIRGADSSKFDFTAADGMLKFKDAPDFEKPADADKDNVYEVTITATDGNANMATRDVKVTVTNAEEDGRGNPVSDPAAGRIGDNRGLQRSRRRVGQRHLAVVEDQWPTIRTATAPVLPDEDGSRLPAPQWLMIAGATSATYTPVADDEADEVGRGEVSASGGELHRRQAEP